MRAATASKTTTLTTINKRNHFAIVGLKRSGVQAFSFLAKRAN
jgi:hypothetical protein